MPFQVTVSCGPALSYPNDLFVVPVTITLASGPPTTAELSFYAFDSNGNQLPVSPPSAELWLVPGHPVAINVSVDCAGAIYPVTFVAQIRVGDRIYTCQTILDPSLWKHPGICKSPAETKQGGNSTPSPRRKPSKQ